VPPSLPGAVRRAIGCVAVAFLAAAVPGPARAQQPASAGTAALHGRVVERRTGAPVAQAEVLVDGRAVATAEDGSWRLAGVAAGARTVQVRRIGYETRRVSVALAAGADTSLTLELAPLALALDEVVVTAARRPQRLADVSVATEVVSREAIEATGAADLAAVLTEQTGIQFQEGHPSGAGVMLQGLSSERVLVLVDGQPLYGRVAGNFDVARIPTAIVERVEVVKGPQSALYGSEAMGGVVNVVTRKPDAGRWDGSARLTTGGDGRLDAGVSGTASLGALGLTADLGRRTVERAPGRESAAGALAERTDAAARLAWRVRPGLDVDANVLLLDERQRWSSGGLYDFADNVQASGGAGATWTLGRHLVRAATHLSHFDHLARRSQFDRPIAGTGDRQTQRLAEAELLYSGPLLGAVLDGGVEARQERIMSTDGRIEGGTRTLVSLEPFLQADWSVARWSLVPGARLSWNERWGTTLTPRLALRYRATDGLSVRAAAGRGFRAPDFKELYLQFTNDGAGYAVYGNADLRPEHSTNLSAGLEWTGVRLYARAQGFWNDLQDFIETRAEPDAGSLVRYRYANVSRGRTWGAELEGGLALQPVRVEGSYTYLGTEDGATGRPLLGRPTHAGRLGLTWTPARGPRLSLTGLYTGSTPMQRDSAGAVTSTRDAFARLDARVAQRLPIGLELTLGADNVFDTRPAAWADAVGRQWYVGLAWTTNSPFRD